MEIRGLFTVSPIHHEPGGPIVGLSVQLNSTGHVSPQDRQMVADTASGGIPSSGPLAHETGGMAAAAGCRLPEIFQEKEERV